MYLHAANQKIGRIKWQKEWISAVDSYLTLSHQSLYKEDEGPKIIRELSDREIMLHEVTRGE